MKKYLLLLQFFICSCSVDNVKDLSPTLQIDLSQSEYNIVADSIFEAAKYIPLETTDNSLISTIDKIIIYDNTFYILDKKQKSIILFNNQGKYINKLNNIGRGPNEYLSLEDFFIDNDTIYIFSSVSQKIIIHNLDFSPIRSFKVPTYGTNISLINDKIYLYTNFRADNLRNFYAINKVSGKIEDCFSPFEEKKKGVSYSKTTFSKYKDKLYCFLPFDYSIYSIQDFSLSKISNLNFGKDKMFPEQFKDYSYEEQKDYKIAHYKDWFDLPINGINNLYWSDKFIFFTFTNAIFPYIYFKSHESGKQIFGNLQNSETFLLANNAFGYINDSCYICINSPEDIHSYLERKYKLPECLQNLKIDDNPVLSVFTLKFK